MAALPLGLHALHIAGDQYGVAWAALLIAAALWARRPTWTRETLALAILAVAIADTPVLHDSLTELLGASWAP